MISTSEICEGDDVARRKKNGEIKVLHLDFAYFDKKKKVYLLFSRREFQANIQVGVRNVVYLLNLTFFFSAPSVRVFDPRKRANFFRLLSVSQICRLLVALCANRHHKCIHVYTHLHKREDFETDVADWWKKRQSVSQSFRSMKLSTIRRVQHVRKCL